MFKNPGGSLKTYGKVVFFIFAIAAVIGGIMMFAGAMVLGGIVLIAAGIFVAYLLSIFVIAFGELVENSTMIRRMMENGNTIPNVPQQAFVPQPVQQENFQPVENVPEKTVDLNKESDMTVMCQFCGTANKTSASFCRNCGKKLG